MSDKHTPTPWEVAVIDSGDTAYGIYGPNGEVIADIPTMAHCVEDADARYLVRAVNAHDALVSTLREARDMAYGLARAAAKDVSTDVRVIAAEMERRFDAAIKLAEGE